jgi:hypothetical protein
MTHITGFQVSQIYNEIPNARNVKSVGEGGQLRNGHLLLTPSETHLQMQLLPVFPLQGLKLVLF